MEHLNEHRAAAAKVNAASASTANHANGGAAAMPNGDVAAAGAASAETEKLLAAVSKDMDAADAFAAIVFAAANAKAGWHHHVCTPPHVYRRLGCCVQIGSYGGHRIRAVTHHQVTDADVEAVLRGAAMAVALLSK
jgi:hypothetical protein